VEYRDYSVDDLVGNPSFRRMVKGAATPEETERWGNWMEENDGNRRTAKKAISVIVGFEFADSSGPDVEEEWSKLYKKTLGRKYTQSIQKRSRISKLGWVVRAAAVLLLASIVGIGVHHFSGKSENLPHLEQITGETTVYTEEGEMKTLSFSNGARVVVNSNSRITYSLGLLKEQVIHVVLEGEAWFETGEDSAENPSVFEVNTPDGIIRNVGTKFLVATEHEKSRVILQEGIVEIEPKSRNGERVSGERPVYRIEKGELIEFNRDDIVHRAHVNPTFYTAWATQFMEFDQTGLQEFAEYVEERFDVNVKINDPDLKDVTLNGAVYFRSLDELIRAVSEVTGISMYRSAENDSVYIGLNN
jgi:ferric-dicitrate binding protein FerR (iron transport regulator)